VAVWDQEDSAIVTWDSASNRVAQGTLGNAMGRGVSSGGGRLSWVTPTDDLVVASVILDGGIATMGAELGRLDDDRPAIAGVIAGPGGGTPAGALTFGGRRTVDRAFRRGRQVPGGHRGS
jgi:hypothetical protein